MRAVFHKVDVILFSDFFMKTCCGYSFELPQLVFYKEVDKSTMVVI